MILSTHISEAPEENARTTRRMTGFASPAADCMEGMFDLNDHLIKRPAATFIMRVEGDSMTGAGICNGDLAVVDRSLSPQHNDIVIAVVAGEMTVRRLVKARVHFLLAPENPAYRPVVIHDQADLVIWGVVSAVISQIRTA